MSFLDVTSQWRSDRHYSPTGFCLGAPDAAPYSNMDSTGNMTLNGKRGLPFSSLPATVILKGTCPFLPPSMTVQIRALL